MNETILIRYIYKKFVLIQILSFVILFRYTIIISSLVNNPSLVVDIKNSLFKFIIKMKIREKIIKKIIKKINFKIIYYFLIFI